MIELIPTLALTATGTLALAGGLWRLYQQKVLEATTITDDDIAEVLPSGRITLELRAAEWDYFKKRKAGFVLTLTNDQAEVRLLRLDWAYDDTNMHAHSIDSLDGARAVFRKCAELPASLAWDYMSVPVPEHVKLLEKHDLEQAA